MANPPSRLHAFFVYALPAHLQDLEPYPGPLVKEGASSYTTGQLGQQQCSVLPRDPEGSPLLSRAHWLSAGDYRKTASVTRFRNAKLFRLAASPIWLTPLD